MTEEPEDKSKLRIALTHICKDEIHLVRERARGKVHDEALRAVEEEAQFQARLAEEEVLQRAMKDVTWDNLNGCWGIRRHGMYIGIETDGYAHT